MLNPQIITLPETKLVGIAREMSLMENQTKELWQDFMPQRNTIQNRIGNDFYSIQLYDKDYFNTFNPSNIFKKWAAVPVAHFSFVPNTMDTIVIPKGLYAVFEHKGNSTTIFEKIFTEWLPNSNYFLDHRPHFEVLGSKYKNNDPNSEEQIWIPIHTKI